MIREATVRDVPELVALGQRFLAESSYAGSLKENPAQMELTATRLIDQDDGTVFVSEDDGQVVGTIGLLRFVHHFSGELTVGECFLFVDPQARGSIGVRLITAAKAWATDQGATSLQVVAPEGATRVEQLYEALHFHKLETAFGLTL